MLRTNLLKKKPLGRIWKYGDNINTDLIFPGKHTYTITDKQEMAQYALEDLDSDFAAQVEVGDIIVAGKNWGCGSSREQAVTCLLAAGIQGIIAVSFARIFYRNAINNGLPVITCPAAIPFLSTGESLGINLAGGIVYNSEREWTFPPLPLSVLNLLEAGGLIPYLRDTLA